MSNTRNNILIFGPQGSGKGTQAQKLAKLLTIPHISPGVMYRQIKNEHTAFARTVQKYIDSGKLVPDHHTNELVKKRIQEPDCKKGFILDGYPRNRIQAKYVHEHIPIDYLIAINLSDKEGIKRIAGRRMCPEGHTYHEIYAPPQKEGICDIDGLKLFQRADEKEDAIKQRLAIYHKETEPLIDEFKKWGVSIITIDGSPSIDDVWAEIKQSFTSS